MPFFNKKYNQKFYHSLRITKNDVNLVKTIQYFDAVFQKSSPISQ